MQAHKAMAELGHHSQLLQWPGLVFKDTEDLKQVDQGTTAPGRPDKTLFIYNEHFAISVTLFFA